MSDVLCIRFREPELSPLSSLAWVLLSPQAEVLDSGHCLLQDLDNKVPAKNGPRQTTIIAPTESLLLTKISVPEAQRRHLRQVLPFIVEEQIIDPIESMHLVVPALAVEDSMLVGCVRRELLEQWLQLFQAVEIEPDRLVADALCVPRENTDWQLLYDDARVLLHQADGGEGMCLTADTSQPVLEIMLNQAVDSEAGSGDENLVDEPGLVDSPAPTLSRPASIGMFLCNAEPFAELAQERARILVDSPAPENSELSGDVSGNEVHEIPEPHVQPPESASTDEMSDETDFQQRNAEERKKISEYVRSENVSAELTDLSETASEALAITAVREQEGILNFLQGDFTPLNANAATRKFIARVGMACAACLAIFLIVTLAGGLYLNIRADDYHAKSVAIYKELFPKQRRVRDPVRQMKSQLRGGSVSATVSDFLPLLDVASKSLQQIEEQADSDTTIKQLRYDAQRGSINMELQTNNIDELESYRDLLSGEGLSVDILSANQDDGIVSGRLQIGRS